MRQQVGPSLIVKQRPRRGRRGAERTTTGGCPRTPDGMASGRQVRCAAGGGGDGDRIGGKRVGCAFWMQRPEFIKSGLAGLTADYDILRNVVRRNETTGRTLSLIAKQRPRRGLRGAGRTTTGGHPRTPDWVAAGGG